MMLTLSSVRALIGGKPVLDDFSLWIAEGEVVGLIGAPGCGKSTLLHAVFGLVSVSSGTIRYAEADVTNSSPRENIRRGMVLVSQGGRAFRGLSVEENLYLGGSILNDQKSAERVAVIYELFPRLKERRTQTAGSLSGGERQMLALGIGLMPEPKLLLLDEPSTGLSPLLTETMLGEIKSLRRRLDCTMLVVEQNVKNALLLADRVVVMRRGRVEYSHDLSQTKNVQTLLDAYSFRRAVGTDKLQI